MERDILKKAVPSFPKTRSEVLLHPGSSGSIPGGDSVPGARGFEKRLLRLASSPESPASRANRLLSRRLPRSTGTAAAPTAAPGLPGAQAPRQSRRPAPVARLMRRDGLQAKTKRRFKATTDSRHSYPVAPELLHRNFTPKDPTGFGLRTLPISGAPRGGCTWQSSWTCTRVVLSAGPWRRGSRRP